MAKEYDVSGLTSVELLYCLLAQMYREYDLGGISMGRSLQSRILEASFHVFFFATDVPNKLRESMAWAWDEDPRFYPDFLEAVIAEANTRTLPSSFALQDPPVPLHVLSDAELAMLLVVYWYAYCRELDARRGWRTSVRCTDAIALWIPLELRSTVLSEEAIEQAIDEGDRRRYIRRLRDDIAKYNVPTETHERLRRFERQLDDTVVVTFKLAP